MSGFSGSNHNEDEDDEVIELLPLVEEKFDADFVVPDESLTEILTRVSRPGWKPDISALPDAVVNGEFLVKPGEKLLIEYANEPTRDTVCWLVLAVFPHVEDELTIDPGHVRLYAHGKMHYGCTNFKTAAAQGLILKIPDGKRKWTQGEDETLMERKGKRRRRNFVKDEVEKEVRPLIGGEPAKKKRGRPKGSKSKTTLEREAKEHAAKGII